MEDFTAGDHGGGRTRGDTQLERDGSARLGVLARGDVNGGVNILRVARPYFASFTMPTISTSSPILLPSSVRYRLPMGFCPAKNFLAIVWFTIATLGDSGVSCALKSRPATRSVPSVSKNRSLTSLK